jgi:hypothetical protein
MLEVRNRINSIEGCRAVDQLTRAKKQVILKTAVSSAIHRRRVSRCENVVQPRGESAHPGTPSGFRIVSIAILLAKTDHPSPNASNLGGFSHIYPSFQYSLLTIE